MHSRKYVSAALTLGLLCILFLTGLLFFEWQLLVHHKERMIALKEEYQSYLEDLQLNYGCSEEEEEGMACGEGFFIEPMTKESPESLAERHELISPLEAVITSSQGSSQKFSTLSTPVPSSKKVAHSSYLFKPKNKYPQYDLALKWPVRFDSFWLSSYFGPRRKRDHSWGFHRGIDLAALKGTPVYASAQGRVIKVAYAPKGYGKHIEIMHTKKYKTRYAHLDTIGVKVGDVVAEGALIGRVGDTGLVRGKNASHLHFEVLLFGKPINPLYILK